MSRPTRSENGAGGLRLGKNATSTSVCGSRELCGQSNFPRDDIHRSCAAAETIWTSASAVRPCVYRFSSASKHSAATLGLTEQE